MPPSNSFPRTCSRVTGTDPYFFLRILPPRHSDLFSDGRDQIEQRRHKERAGNAMKTLVHFHRLKSVEFKYQP